ncbi:hypothetical protein D3C87_301330 [compost metagenome]
MKKLMMAALVPALLVGCSNEQSQTPKGSGGFFEHFMTQSAPAITITAIDDTPLVGAQILIGYEVDATFPGNFLTTDQNGQVQLPAEWTEALPVTVQAEGYVRATYLSQEPGALTIKLRKLPMTQQFEVRGNTQGLPIVDKDGYVDFGLIMPAFSKADLLAFDINNVISPQSDRISTLGQDIDIPTNISLPKQSEKYSFFTATLDKPLYRIYFQQPGVTRVYAARGRFPFKTVVDSVRKGAEFYELINEFKINGGGVRDIEVKSGKTTLDIPVRELNYTEKKEVLAPTIAGDEVFLAVGVANQSGLLIPTDVKKINSNKKMALTVLPEAEQMVLGVLKKAADLKKSGDRMSATILPLVAGVNPKMLPLIPDPSVRNGEIILPKFNTIDGVNPIATYSVLSKEIEVVQGSAKVKLMTPLWDVYAGSWVETMKLPQWPGETPVTGKKRWEVNFVGSQTASQSAVGPAMIEAATHVTHSSVTF